MDKKESSPAILDLFHLVSSKVSLFIMVNLGNISINANIFILGTIQSQPEREIGNGKNYPINIKSIVRIPIQSYIFQFYQFRPNLLQEVSMLSFRSISAQKLLMSQFNRRRPSYMAQWILNKNWLERQYWHFT